MSAYGGPLGDERLNRGPELPPTRAVLAADAIMRVSGAAAAGCFALVAALPFLALLGRLGVPEAPPDFLPVFGGPLLAGAIGAALFSVLLGYATTIRSVALARMYAAGGETPSLRNAVEFHGPVSSTPFFAATFTSTALGVLALAAGGVLFAASAWPAAAVALVVIGVLCVASAFVLAAADRRWSRSAPDVLPKPARGEWGSTRLVVGSDDQELQQRLSARSLAERGGLERATSATLVALAVATAAVMAPSLGPGLAVWRYVQTLGVAVCVLGIAALAVLGVARIVRLARTLRRVRAGVPDVTELDRSRAMTATTTLARAVRTTAGVWAVVGPGALGVVIQRGMPPATVLLVAAIVALGFAGLVLLCMRVEAAGPRLREEFGYRLPAEHLSDNGGAW